MKFIGAYQSLAELSEKIEILIQESGKAKEQLLVVTQKAHEADVSSLVDIPVKAVSEDILNKSEPLEEFGLDHETAELYDQTIRHGGYVLLEGVQDENHVSTGTRDAKEDPISDEGSGNIPAPGFGVSQDTPQSDASTSGENPFKDESL